jgi:putative nucleotidyltransferase with HDIG domain
MRQETKLLLDQTIPLEQAGDWDSAIELYSEVFRRSLAERNLPNLIEAVLRAGLCYRHRSDQELAREHLQLAISMSVANGDDLRAGRAYNGLATLHHMHGELSEAEDCYEHARRFAVLASDAMTSGHIQQNLGTLASIRGDAREAVEHYRVALGHFETIGHTKGLAGVYNNLGMLHINLDDLSTSDNYLREALRLFREIGDKISEGVVHLNLTELFLATGDLERARSSCDEAFELVSRLGQIGSRVDALKYYGVIYRDSNKPYLAETHLREAIEVASTHRFPLEEAEAQRELALVLQSQSRNQEALEALNRSHELFAGLRARQDQADISRRITQLEVDFLSLVTAWGESIEAKDRYTRGHCQRVAEYACRIAERAGIAPRDMIWFRMGAFLHDVGKTGIPGELLNKPGRLTDVERELIETHTTVGDEMLAPIAFPWNIRPMVRSHHERWDGRGYPDQLRGEHIPLPARILRIADVFDALTTSRSYREPLRPQQALQIMADDHGAFDPILFEIFRELFEEFALSAAQR